MAVQQNKKSPSKRGMHRSHDFLVAPQLAVEPTTQRMRGFCVLLVVI
jgi:large subunit ribosomal protein L32